jgi:hypothetical protein
MHSQSEHLHTQSSLHFPRSARVEPHAACRHDSGQLSRHRRLVAVAHCKEFQADVRVHKWIWFWWAVLMRAIRRDELTPSIDHSWSLERNPRFDDILLLD